MHAMQHLEIMRELRQINEHLASIKGDTHTMTTTATPGLLALTQAASDLTTAVNANTAAVQGDTEEITAAAAAIATAVSQLAASEDPAVQALAAQIETQVAAINSSTANITSGNESLTTAVNSLTPAPGVGSIPAAPAGSSSSATTPIPAAVEQPEHKS